MPAYLEKFTAIVMYQKAYRERDLLVKLFTYEHGKRMFLVRGAQNIYSPLKASLTPFTYGTYVGRLTPVGLSFINENVTYTFPKQTLLDPEAHAYTSYIVSLADAAVGDQKKESELYHQLQQSINLIESGLDPQIISEVFSLQLLKYFGVFPNLSSCTICNKKIGRFDFSMTYDGLLCEEHYSYDIKRLHLNPNVSFLLMKFSSLKLNKLGDVQLSREIKKELQAVIYAIYDNYVGLRLKSQRYLEQIQNMANNLDEDTPSQV